MTVVRVPESDLLASPEAVLLAAERMTTIITKDGGDRLVLVPLPEYVRLTRAKLDGSPADPLFAELVAEYHWDEATRLTETETFELDADLVEDLRRVAASYGCSLDVVVNAVLHLFMRKENATTL